MDNFFLPVPKDHEFISPDSPNLQYSGRIDFSEMNAPVFIFPYSSIHTIFKSKTLKIILSNHHQYWDNYLGFILDGKQGKVLLPNTNTPICITLADNLEEKEHTLFLFKRMDACHHISFHGLALSEHGFIKAPAPKPIRKMEFYGDSVTAGEVSEAVDYIGKQDPEHNGEFSNSWYSYAAITARKLNAQVHNIAQGGIALLDNTGWFNEPNCIGMESAYDKLCYNTDIAPLKKWDFKAYTPHVVVVAIGQNDNHPVDYMKEDYHCEKAHVWRRVYAHFIRKLRFHYPQATIILTTTILNHDPNWDKSIHDVCIQLKDPGIHHFLYDHNGSGTPGHIRIPEAEQMSAELCNYIESLGNNIWE